MRALWKARQTPATTPSTGAPASSLEERLRVLVVGPVGESGGMARVARMTAAGMDTSRFVLAVCDTAKDTPAGRSLPSACWSHVRRWGRLIRHLRSHRPQLVHLHTCSYQTFYRTMLDAWTCRALRRPYVLHIHGGLFAEFLSSLGVVRRAVVLQTLRAAARVVVLGEVWRRRLAEYVPAGKLAVIPNAVEPPSQNSSGSRTAGVLFVGDLSEVKRPEDAIVAFSALPADVRRRFPFTIVGGGDAPRRRQLEELCKRLGVSGEVVFAGRKAHQEAVQFMRDATILVMPSRAEGMPIALLEAMQTGLPAVVTHVGAIEEMVTDRLEAMLVEPVDPLALARAMKRLLADETLRSRMGAAAQARVASTFTAAQFRASIGRLWQETAIVKRRVAAPPVPRLASTFRSFL